MMGKYYILLETENKEATFIQKVSDDFRFFEIFQLSGNVNFISKACPERFVDIIVSAFTQEDALKQFGKRFPNLKKRSIKEYYETVLIL